MLQQLSAERITMFRDEAGRALKFYTVSEFAMDGQEYAILVRMPITQYSVTARLVMRYGNDQQLIEITGDELAQASHAAAEHLEQLSQDL